jgi:subtilase family serine protease
MDLLRKSISFSFLTLIVFTSLAYAAPQRLRSAIDDGQVTRLKGSVPFRAKAQFDRGPVDPSFEIQGASIVFNRSGAQQAGIEELLRQQQDPKSANYRKWLTPQQYADRFGMSQADIDKVTIWLQSHGLHVDSIAPSRNMIYFSGTAAQIKNTLHTDLHRFVENGEPHFANFTEAALPSAMSDSVLSVRNLNNFRPKPRTLTVRKISGEEPHFNNGPGVHFISPDDLAVIYNLKPLYDAGITGEPAIAVVGQTEVSATDVNAFRSNSGLPANPFHPVLMPGTGTSTVSSDDVMEADLDVEWSGAVARSAPILYVYPGNGKATDGSAYNVIDAFTYAINNNVAPVISISYGLCEASAGTGGRDFFNQAGQQAASQGQTISSASGDSGAADCEDQNATSATHGLAVDLPSAVPEVTGVGGTEFSGDVSNGTPYWASVNDGHDASALAYIPETTWNDTSTANGFSSGGGGASAFVAKPSWQVGTGVPSANHRYVPDISLNASAHHDGYLVCTAGGCVNGFVGSDDKITLVGGTSVGAPIFAGLVGLINQATGAEGQGSVNPTLYQLHASTPSAFHDITTGNNKIPCTSGSTNCPSGTTSIGFNASPGYDQATGLGSLDMFNLVSAWPGFGTNAPYTIAASPSNIAISAAGQSGTSALTVASASGFSGTVALACTPPSGQETTCTVSPSSVSLSLTATSATATLSVSTTAAHAKSGAASASLRGSGWLASGALMFAGVFALVLPARRRRNATLLSFFLFAFLAAGLGCGGGSSSTTPTTPATPTDAGTAAGSYTIVVNGTSGSVSRPSFVTITVQ